LYFLAGPGIPAKEWKMLSSGIHRRQAYLDPVRAAEEDIRRYLAARHILPAAAPARPARDHTVLCLLSIYAAIALAVGLGMLVVTRIGCDPMFSDWGLKAVCRNRMDNLDKITNLNGTAFSSFRLPDGAQ
jgi:hypothetical protein